MKILPPVATAADPMATKRAQLHKSAIQMEGMFTRQLFSAMRATVPTEGVVDGGAGEEMFSSMFDEHLADEMPKHWTHDLTQQMVTQLGGRIAAQTEPHTK